MATRPTEEAEAPIWRQFGEVALAALVYFALARASLHFASLNANVTPIWPPSGFAIALLLLRGKLLAPAIALGAFAANYAVAPQVVSAAVIALGNTLEAVLAAFLIGRWAKGEIVFQSPVTIGKFAIIVVVAAGPLSATVGATALLATGAAPLSDFTSIWITWWLGNLAGAIIVTPALLLWTRTLRGQEQAPSTATILAVGAGSIFLATIAFSRILPTPPETRGALAFLVVFPLLWSALRLGLRETATMAILISCIAVWGVMAGSSPFIQPTQNSSLVLVVTFMVSVTLPSLALAAERYQSGVLLDQTRQDLAQAQKLKALGALTASVAHDFNNLLAAIGGGLRLLDRPNEERVRAMEALKQTLERGSGLTRQLLAFARREPLKLERIDTNQALESAHDLIRSSLKEGIRSKMRIAPGLWPVKADRSQFEVALLNLAVNAQDAMIEGGDISIQAENIVGEDRANYVVVRVADTGEGMDEETLARAFEPFFSTKAAGQGTGLGLAQVFGFATQCGGTVEIDSVVGQGTTVTITLPRD